MHILVAFAALGLLLLVLFPFVSKRLRAARRGRAVHLGGSCHWYANYDEELHYEPRRRTDIVRLTRSEVLARGYKPTEDVQVVPRTFRHRVPGDAKIRLWRCNRSGVPALWLCEWASDPVRVPIGIGEHVPGVETAPIPLEPQDELVRSSIGMEISALGSWNESAQRNDSSDSGKATQDAADWSELERSRSPEMTGRSAEPIEAIAAARPDAIAGNDGATVDDHSPSADGPVGTVLEAGDGVDPDAPVRRRKKRRRRHH